MPENTDPANGGEQGNQGAQGAQGGAGAPSAGSVQTFTQADVDRIVQERVARAKPADYDDLKTKAAEFDKLQQEQLSEVEKERKAREKAEATAQAALERANSTLKRAAIITEAASQNAADADVVVALLAADDSITIEDDGTVKGAKQAVKKLLEDKPFLVKAAAGAPGASGGQYGGNDARTLQERIREAESKGDWKTARSLKAAQIAGA